MVIVPAKNEEQALPAALKALYQQTDPEGRPINRRCYEVIVLANNCTDATAEVVHRFARAHPDAHFHVVSCHLPPPCAHIGYVRRVLMDEAYRRLMLRGQARGVIASTDSDSTVNTTWVYHTLKAVRQGADAVGGRIRTTSQAIGRKYYLQDVMYRYLQAQLELIIDPQPADPWPRHFQNFGPSLAVTSEFYERAGRMPVLRKLEDVRFYEALQRCDARIRHCPRRAGTYLGPPPGSGRLRLLGAVAAVGANAAAGRPVFGASGRVLGVSLHLAAARSAGAAAALVAGVTAGGPVVRAFALPAVHPHGK